MSRRSLLSILIILAACFSAYAQSPTRVMVMPFTNTAGKDDIGWIGSSFSEAVPELLEIYGQDSMADEKRRELFQVEGIPASSAPSLASSLQLAQKGRVAYLVVGSYLPVSESVLKVEMRLFALSARTGGKGDRARSSGPRVLREMSFDVDRSDRSSIFKQHGTLAYEISYALSPSLGFPREVFEKSALDRLALELAHLDFTRGRWSQARDAFMRISEKQPGKSMEYGAEALFYAALCDWVEAKLDDSLKKVNEAAERLKGNTRVRRPYPMLNLLGAIAVRSQRSNSGGDASVLLVPLSDGLAYFATANRLNPSDPDLWFNYSIAALMLKEPESLKEAKKLMEAFTERRSGNGEGWFLLAKVIELLNPENADAPRLANDNALRLLKARYADLESNWRATGSLEGINLRVRPVPKQDFRKGLRDENPPRAGSAAVTTAPNFAKRYDEAEKLLDPAKTEEGPKTQEAMALLEALITDLASVPTATDEEQGYLFKARLLLGKAAFKEGQWERARDVLKSAAFSPKSNDQEQELNFLRFEIYRAIAKRAAREKDCPKAQNNFREAEDLPIEGEKKKSMLAALRSDLDSFSCK